ncbi:hypothetical protein [Streptomyces sp. NPDC046939]|uniref:hypothetical protein n=1 Tax=Streptomyces sp. NPDC046939 TaxID=3155376 RepID=UPI0033EF0595
MSEDVPTDRPGPAGLPETGALMVDTSRRSRVGEFRGAVGSYWYLRPVTGGVEWEVAPQDARPADPGERLSAETARANARSRGDVL